MKKIILITLLIGSSSFAEIKEACKTDIAKQQCSDVDYEKCLFNQKVTPNCEYEIRRTIYMQFVNECGKDIKAICGNTKFEKLGQCIDSDPGAFGQNCKSLHQKLLEKVRRDKNK